MASLTDSKIMNSRIADGGSILAGRIPRKRSTPEPKVDSEDAATRGECVSFM